MEGRAYIEFGSDTPTPPDSVATQASYGSLSDLGEVSAVDIRRVQHLKKEREEQLLLIRNRIEKLKGAESQVWKDITKCKVQSTQLQEAQLRNQSRHLEELEAQRYKHVEQEEMRDVAAVQRDGRQRRLRVVQSSVVQQRRQAGESGRLESKKRMVQVEEEEEKRWAHRVIQIERAREEDRRSKMRRQFLEERRREERRQRQANELAAIERETRDIEDQLAQEEREEMQWITRLKNSQTMRQAALQALETISIESKVPVRRRDAAICVTQRVHQPGAPLGQIVEEPEELQVIDICVRSRSADRHAKSKIGTCRSPLSPRRVPASPTSPRDVKTDPARSQSRSAKHLAGFSPRKLAGMSLEQLQDLQNALTTAYDSQVKRKPRIFGGGRGGKITSRTVAEGTLHVTDVKGSPVCSSRVAAT
mmetsp:Transcript_34801/g.76202  ORF Transcript_34801/g.76202 Transcript_34801/m.76202 type:complete len:420 (+) Transcript_34801:65-1324(+)